MSRQLSQSAVTCLLSRAWKAAVSAATLPSAKDKLERPCRLYRRNRRAAAAVEFAIVAPVFFLLVLGMIEYGRMVMVQQVLTNASREGARAAVLDGADWPEVEALVTSYLTSGSISGATVTKPSNFDTAEFGDPMTITVSVPFNQVSWLPSPMYLGGKTLSATTIMRRESVQ
jgi:Flp pilus assembly protein TadG